MLETIWNQPLGGFVVALGVGLVIGVERERSKSSGPESAPAGVRTFSLAALLGATAAITESVALVVVLAAAVAALAAVSHHRTSPDDPGLTTEIALLLTYGLGVLALREPTLTAGLGVLVALLLASRSWLHELARRRLTDQEMLDGLLIAGAALIVLPLLPDRAIDPWGVVNPQTIWRLTVVVLTINAAGYVALRALGAGIGLALAGLFSGFVSSTATIGAMGARARSGGAVERAAVAGAALSSVATVIQLALVVAIADRALLAHLAPGLAAMGVVAVLYGAAYTWRAARDGEDVEAPPGRAFQPRHAIVFALTVTLVLLVAAYLAERYGAAGAVSGIALAGFADAHSPSASAAGLAAAGTLERGAAAFAVLLAVSANTVSKAVVAHVTGGAAFARALLPGLALMLAALWIAVRIGGGW